MSAIIYGPCDRCSIGLVRDAGDGPECGVCGQGYDRDEIELMEFPRGGQ